MTETRTTTQEFQGEILKTVSKSQEAVIDAIKTWADAVKSITPKLPAVDIPLADKLPTPSEFVASAYDFAEELLASQRKFAMDVLAATAPLMPAKGKAAAAKN
jgi:hypothetical protein